MSPNHKLKDWLVPPVVVPILLFILVIVAIVLR
ncbi:hypothetical protein I8G32_04137 [Rhodopseudomonas palustris]|nr:hypothetical protein I8G32_04137 [Rhodopseudomonas palustris]